MGALHQDVARNHVPSRWLYCIPERTLTWVGCKPNYIATSKPWILLPYVSMNTAVLVLQPDFVAPWENIQE